MHHAAAMVFQENNKRSLFLGSFVQVGAGIERLMIQNNDGASEDESMEIFDLAGNQHSDNIPSETVKQMYNASAEEIRNTTPKYISCCMKFVIKDHLEMIPDILTVIEKMTKDEDKLMRFDTVSTVGYLCTVFHQHENLRSYIHSFLLPAIIKALSDPAEQVIMRAQMVLTYIISKGVINNKTIEDIVCPALILAANSTDDLHVQNNIVTLVGKIVLKINDDVLCKTVLPFLINKSHSDCIYVRLAALLSFPELGHALDIDHKTKILLPRYFEMCNDRVGTIRKTCADIITPLSVCCDDALRRGPITDAAGRLLSDSCKFVRQTALENLGPLITTYASPAVTSLVTTRTLILMMVSNFTDDLHYITMKCQTSQEYFKATELLMDREKPWSNETTMKNDNK